MSNTNYSRMAILTVCATALVSVAAAQSKVGIVNSQVAILETAEIKKAQAEMEAKFKPRQDEIIKLQQEIQDIQQQLQKMAGKLTPQAERDLTLQGQNKQRKLKRMTEDLQADVDNERNDTLARVGRQMQAVVQKLAEEKELDVVIDVANTIYYKPTLEMTKEATAAYDLAYPVQ